MNSNSIQLLVVFVIKSSENECLNISDQKKHDLIQLPKFCNLFKPFQDQEKSATTYSTLYFTLLNYRLVHCPLCKELYNKGCGVFTLVLMITNKNAFVVALLPILWYAIMSCKTFYGSYYFLVLSMVMWSC